MAPTPALWALFRWTWSPVARRIPSFTAMDRCEKEAMSSSFQPGGGHTVTRRSPARVPTGGSMGRYPHEMLHRKEVLSTSFFHSARNTVKALRSPAQNSSGCLTPAFPHAWAQGTRLLHVQDAGATERTGALPQFSGTSTEQPVWSRQQTQRSTCATWNSTK